MECDAARCSLLNEFPDRFRANASEKDPSRVMKLLREGEAEFAENKHPDPYIRTA